MTSSSVQIEDVNQPIKGHALRRFPFLLWCQRDKLLAQFIQGCVLYLVNRTCPRAQLKMKKFISQIKPYSAIGITIRVRAALKWRPRMFDSSDYNGLHYLLVDQQGSSIHAMIEECYYNHMQKLMQVGKIYDVSRFASKKDTAKHRIANHDAILCFSEFTQFEEVEDELPNFPKHSFNLRQFGQLAVEAQQQTLLADLYGCIKSVRAPQVVDVDNPKEKETRTDLSIQLIGREELKISLWADVARLFPVQEITELPPPVLAVFTGMRISMYEGRVSAYSTPHTCFIINPDIEEKEQFEAEFSKNGDKLNVSTTYSSLMSTGIINEADRRIVPELNMLDPTLHMTKSVYCTAVVRRFFVDKAWFYRCCPVDKCYKHMLKKEEIANRYICIAHGEQKPKLNTRVYMVIQDDFDQARVTVMGKSADEFFGATCEELLNETPYPPEITLPSQISSKVGQQFMFEIRISQRGELFVRSSRKSEFFAGTTGGNTTGAEKGLKITESKEPFTETPDKITYGRKREIQTSAKQLFGSTGAKKIKRDREAGSSSSKDIAE